MYSRIDDISLTRRAPDRRELVSGSEVAVDGSVRRKWARTARRAVAAHLAENSPGISRIMPGESIGDLLDTDDVIVIQPRMASAWLIRHRPTDNGLDAQLSAVFDRVTVVVPEQSIEDTISTAAPQFAVHSIRQAAGRPALFAVRDATQEPAYDAGVLGRLLWRDDLAAVLRSYGQPVRPFAVRAELLDQLLICCSAIGARTHILAHLLS